MNKFLYFLKNVPNRLRDFTVGHKTEATQSLHARVIKGGVETDLGVICKRSVTNLAVQHILTQMAAGAALNVFQYHASGTGVVAEASADTSLGATELTGANVVGGARVAGAPTVSVVVPNAPTYTSVATIGYLTNGLAVTEHGLFSAIAAGMMLDRSQFAAINVNAGDSIVFTYVLTMAAAG